MELDVLGRKISCKVIENLKDETGRLDGNYCPEEFLIEVDKEKVECKITLLHEMGHAMFHRLGCELDPNLEEILVESFANVVNENFDIKLK